MYIHIEQGIFISFEFLGHMLIDVRCSYAWFIRFYLLIFEFATYWYFDNKKACYSTTLWYISCFYLPLIYVWCWKFAWYKIFFRKL